MKHATELQLQAWIDGELKPKAARRMAKRVAADLPARELETSLRSVREALRTGELQRPTPESREFYWSGIQRRIAAAELVKRGERARPGFGFWSRLRWLAPAVGAAAVGALLFTLHTPANPGLEGLKIATEIDNPLADVSSVTFQSEQDNMTVVWVSMK